MFLLPCQPFKNALSFVLAAIDETSPRTLQCVQFRRTGAGFEIAANDFTRHALVRLPMHLGDECTAVISMADAARMRDSLPSSNHAIVSVSTSHVQVDDGLRPALSVRQLSAKLCKPTEHWFDPEHGRPPSVLTGENLLPLLRGLSALAGPPAMVTHRRNGPMLVQAAQPELGGCLFAGFAILGA